MAISAQWYTRAVTLDCADGHVGDMYANEGDANGRGIDLSLFDGKEPANTTGMSVYLAWGHEAGGEGLTPFSAVDAAHGRWRVLYPTAMQRSGTVLARIMVYLNATAPRYRAARTSGSSWTLIRWTGARRFRFGLEFTDFLDLEKVGAVTVKGTSLEPQPGNKGQRAVETPSGMLNSIGLENPGVDYFWKQRCRNCVSMTYR